VKDLYASGTGPLTGESVKINRGEYHLVANGAGSFRIETLMRDGTWQYSDETTFESPTHQIVDLSTGAYRISIVSGTVSVELRG
jgi:hypothetical protein